MFDPMKVFTSLLFLIFLLLHSSSVFSGVFFGCLGWTLGKEEKERENLMKRTDKWTAPSWVHSEDCSFLKMREWPSASPHKSRSMRCLAPFPDGFSVLITCVLRALMVKTRGSLLTWMAHQNITRSSLTQHQQDFELQLYSRHQIKRP